MDNSKQFFYPIAISAVDLRKYGCPHCGCATTNKTSSFKATTVWQCNECQEIWHVPGDGSLSSDIITNGYLPVIRDHPFGVTIKPRRIVYSKELDCRCYICNRTNNVNEMFQTISFFLYESDDVRRASNMLDHKLVANPRNGIGRTRVKIGACDKHLGHLRILYRILRLKKEIRLSYVNRSRIIRASLNLVE